MATLIRELGDYPVSIGTSRAFEGLFGKIDPPLKQRSYKSFGHLWINLETLIRNIIEAYSTEDLKLLDVSEVVTSLFEELEAIQTLVADESNGKLNLVVYFDDANERKWVFPHAEWRQPTTERQTKLHVLNSLSLRQAIAIIRERKMPLTVIRKRPTITHDNVVILTHHPHNLLWSPTFNYLMLLESYTGVLKDSNQWSSKLKGISEKDQIPFNAFTLQVLGDGSLFAGESRIIQRELKTLKNSCNWSKVTTSEKIVSDVKRHGSAVLKEAYNKLMTRH